MFDVAALNLGLLILRLVIGLTLTVHGVVKYRNGIGGAAGWFASMGLKPGPLHAHLAASTEILAGLALAVGFLTPLAAMAYIGVMTVAGWLAHRKNGFMITKQGWEYVFVLGASAAGLAATGPGEWSLDNAMGVAWNGVPWLIVAAGGGIVAGAALMAVFYRPPAAD